MADYEATQGYIRYRYRDIGGAFAQYVSAAPVLPLGHFELTVSTTALGLPSIPADARRVVIYSDQKLSWVDDGSTPTSAHGMILPAGTVFVYDTDPDANFKMVLGPGATGDADVRVAYYG